MALKQPTPAPNDPRLQGHERTYEASRGGHYKPEEKPVPGTPKR